MAAPCGADDPNPLSMPLVVMARTWMRLRIPAMTTLAAADKRRFQGGGIVDGRPQVDGDGEPPLQEVLGLADHQLVGPGRGRPVHPAQIVAVLVLAQPVELVADPAHDRLRDPHVRIRLGGQGPRSDGIHPRVHGERGGRTPDGADPGEAEGIGQLELQRAERRTPPAGMSARSRPPSAPRPGRAARPGSGPTAGRRRRGPGRPGSGDTRAAVVDDRQLDPGRHSGRHPGRTDVADHPDVPALAARPTPGPPRPGPARRPRPGTAPRCRTGRPPTTSDERDGQERPPSLGEADPAGAHQPPVRPWARARCAAPRRPPRRCRRR